MCGAASCVTTLTSNAAPAPTNTHASGVGRAPARTKISAKDLAADAARAAERETKRQAAMKMLAPGDEYFGPLKQSIIGIRNTIRDIGQRYDVNHDIAKQSFASAQLTERSVRDWETKYPKDTQLPRAVYLLQRLYTKVLLQESRDRARVIAAWLATDFPRSGQANQLKKILASEHLAPLAPPTPEPTPVPSTTPFESIFGPAFPSEFNPLATPTPQATASSSTTRTARPALPQASAAPSPTPQPAPSPAAAATAAPPLAAPSSSPSGGSATPAPTLAPSFAPTLTPTPGPTR